MKRFHIFAHRKSLQRAFRIQVRDNSKSSSNGNVNSRTSLDEESAYKLVLNLEENKRALLKMALNKLESNMVRKQLEDELAATRWRSMFAHPSKSVLEEVEPRGAYCPMTGLQTDKDAARPESSDLLKLFFVNAIPFVGFGFVDNFIMIAAGDYIEYVFATFCLSTMASAALGNTVSDIVSMVAAGHIERGCETNGLKPPNLSKAQMEMNSSKTYAQWGKIVGITIGCLLGMCPLLFMGKKEDGDNSRG